MRRKDKTYHDRPSGVTVTLDDSIPPGCFVNNTDHGYFGLDISEYDFRRIEHSNPNNPMEANAIIKNLKHR